MWWCDVLYWNVFCWASLQHIESRVCMLWYLFCWKIKLLLLLLLLKLIDFGSKIKALKIGFVKRLLDNSSGRWKSPAAYFYQTSNIKRYFQSNHAMSKEIYHKFYSDIHNFWSELQTIDKPTHIVIQNQILWNNRYITIENVPYERNTVRKWHSEWKWWLSKSYWNQWKIWR